MAEKSTEGKKWGVKQSLILVGAVVIVAAVIASVYFYNQYKKAQQLLQNPTLVQQQQTQALLTAVGKLIELPNDETPTVATVSDVTKLQGQPFFAKAKNGDKVLIYTKNREAILYDPVANIIVNVAPVNIGTVTPTLSPVPAVRITPRITPKDTPAAAR